MDFVDGILTGAGRELYLENSARSSGLSLWVKLRGAARRKLVLLVLAIRAMMVPSLVAPLPTPN